MIWVCLDQVIKHKPVPVMNALKSSQVKDPTHVAIPEFSHPARTVI